MEGQEKEREEDFPPVEFIYEEEPDLLKQDVQEEPEDAQEPGIAKPGIGTLFLVMAALVIGLGIGLLFRAGGKNAEEPDGGEEAGESVYVQKMREYLEEQHGSKISEQTEHGNGMYALGAYVITDLDGDGIYPEAVGMIWDETLGRCVLEMYWYMADKTEQIGQMKDPLEELEQDGKEVEGLLLNRMEERGSVDIILTGRRPDGGSFSAFYRYGMQACSSAGSLEGIPVLQRRRMEDGQVQEVYDTDGVYRIEKEYADRQLEVTGAKAVQNWEISASGRLVRIAGEAEWSDAYWKLEGMPVWYMRRPVHASSPDGSKVVTLEGAWSRAVAVLWPEDTADNRIHYQVETDLGEAGLLTLEYRESRDSCMVYPEDAAFGTLFSDTQAADAPEQESSAERESDEEQETVPGYDPWEEEPTEPETMTGQESGFVGFLTEPVQIALEKTQADIVGFCDLDRDGHEEQIRLCQYEGEMDAFGQGQMELRLYVETEEVMHHVMNSVPDQIYLLVLDLDPTDSYMEFGVVWQKMGASFLVGTELFQYRAGVCRSLGLEDALGLPGVPQWFSPETGEPLWKDHSVREEGLSTQLNENSYPYTYQLWYDEQENFMASDRIACQWTKPLRGTVLGEPEAIHSELVGETLPLHAGDTVVFDSFEYVTEEEVGFSSAYYICHFTREDGEEGYIAMDIFQLISNFTWESAD